MEKILVINPGSTSTKIAVYDGEFELWKENISHDRSALSKYPTIYDQIDMRYALVMDALKNHGMDASELDAIAARGGPIAPVEGGAYEVNDEMISVAYTHPQDQHVSIIAPIIADRIAKAIGKKAYIYDAVSVDEMLPICKVTGLPSIRRRGQGHNLNMRAAARTYCKQRNLDYHALRLIVVHLGGGISVSLHLEGKIVDIINDEDGCFAPERAGDIPQTQLVQLCFSGKSQAEIHRMLKGNGGLVAWLGTNDTRIVEQKMKQGDKKAKFIYDAMAFNVAKNIGKEAVITAGKIDQIILTGGIAYSTYFTDQIKNLVSWIAPVTIIPGENEMDALALGVLRVLHGEEVAHTFHEENKRTKNAEGICWD